MESKPATLDQLLYDLIECVHNDKLVLGATPDGRPHDPDPEIDKLRKKILRYYAQPGAVWVKASERLPGWGTPVQWRCFEGQERGFKETLSEMIHVRPVSLHSFEWLDESGAASNKATIEFAEWLRINNMSPNAFGGWGGGKINTNYHGNTTTDLHQLWQQSKNKHEK